jgi:3-deoxy-manno-octulosonate cytidylyltransferase (CMP-KDO synthetase)
VPPAPHDSGTDISSTGGVVAAIPVRYASTRLPGKALIEIAGMPMIERVYRRASKARGLSKVIVLTDDERIADVVRGFGGKVEMTPAECASGTDRIAHAARSWNADAILNVQGDEPLIEPGSLEALADHLVRSPQDQVATLAFPADTEDLGTPDVVKVVTDVRGYALYFSRAPIPYPRVREKAPVLRHIGVYGYQRQALLEIAAHEPTPLEQAESLEQLRMLELGIPIRVLRTEHAWPGVDTMDDLQKVEELLRERPELAEY